jgi:hypothetical protein
LHAAPSLSAWRGGRVLEFILIVNLPLHLQKLVNNYNLCFIDDGYLKLMWKNKRFRFAMLHRPSPKGEG